MKTNLILLCFYCHGHSITNFFSAVVRPMHNFHGFGIVGTLCLVLCTGFTQSLPIVRFSVHRKLQKLSNFLGFRERREDEDYVTLARDRLRQISWKLVHVGALKTE